MSEDTYKPIILNEKQQLLANKLADWSDHDVHTQFKEALIICPSDISESGLIFNSFHLANIQFLTSQEIDLKATKITPTFCRNLFGFVPKQITSFAKFIKEIEDYQTYSVMVPYSISQEDCYDDTKRIERINGKDTERISGDIGVIWLTFYGNDTKLVAYEFYPKKASPNRVKFSPKITSVNFKPVTADQNRIQIIKIPLNHLGTSRIDDRPIYLFMNDIHERRYKAINNMTANSVNSFNKDLV